MRARAIHWMALAGLLAAGRAGAEVRLVESPLDGTLAVDILSTPRGPWTPTGTVTAQVLNPAGDLYGDGMPGWDTRTVRVLSAWIRPHSGLVAKAVGVADGWTELPGIASPGACGQPVVDTLTGGWAVTWQVADAEARDVLVTGAMPDGRTIEPLNVGGGVLVGTAPSDNALHVITMDVGTGALWCTTVLFSFVPTQPIPITMTVVARVQLGSGGLGGSSGDGGKQGNGGAIAQRDPRVHDILDSSGESAAVLTWWTASGSVSWVKLGPNGPELPVATVSGRHGQGNAQKLVQSALEEAKGD